MKINIKHIVFAGLALGCLASCSQTLSDTPPATATPLMKEDYYKALNGDTEALWRVGSAYSDGMRGLPKDDRAAANAWETAAKLGHAESCVQIGGAYAAGRGRFQNYSKARKYWQMAHSYGHPKAAGYLKELEEYIAEEERKEAQRRYVQQMEAAQQANRMIQTMMYGY